MKFDQDHVKQEIPPDVEFDVDNDYDIDQNEKDTLINAAVQAANTSQTQNLYDKGKGQLNAQKQ